MKINELNEGPIDFAKKVGAGISGLAQGGIQGAKACLLYTSPSPRDCS